MMKLVLTCSISEAIDGAGKGYAVVAFFTVGTALGGGLVVNGKP